MIRSVVSADALLVLMLFGSASYMKLFRLLVPIASLNRNHCQKDPRQLHRLNADRLEQLNLAPGLNSQHQVGIVLPKPAGKLESLPNLARRKGRYYFPSRGLLPVHSFPAWQESLTHLTGGQYSFT